MYKTGLWEHFFIRVWIHTLRALACDPTETRLSQLQPAGRGHHQPWILEQGGCTVSAQWAKPLPCCLQDDGTNLIKALCCRPRDGQSCVHALNLDLRKWGCPNLDEDLLPSPAWKQPFYKGVFVVLAALQGSIYSQVLLWAGGESTINFCLGLFIFFLLSAVSVNC